MSAFAWWLAIAATTVYLLVGFLVLQLSPTETRERYGQRFVWACMLGWPMVLVAWLLGWWFGRFKDDYP